MPDLNTLLDLKARRCRGETAVLTDDNIINKRKRYTYINFFNKDQYPIYDYPSLEKLEEDFYNYLISKEKEKCNYPIEFHEQLIFSFLKIFNHSLDKNIVNQRLSFFYLCNILCFHEINITEKNEKLREKIFEVFLFFSQNSEYFIDNIKIKENQFNVFGNNIDIVKYNDLYFNYLIQNKNKLTNGDHFIEKDLQFLKAVCSDFFKCLLGESISTLSIEFLGSIKGFFRLYKSLKKEFYEKLEFSTCYYKVGSWESLNTRLSLYYGQKNIPSYEDLNYKASSKISRRVQIEAENFIEMYILYIVNSPDAIIELEEFIKEPRVLNFIKLVIKIHPTIKMDLDKRKWLNTL